MDHDHNPNSFKLKGSDIGILLLHGFTSTPQSVRYVGEGLNRASGATVHCPLLAGHGETPEALAQTGYRDWIDSAEQALEHLGKVCSTVVVAGLSLGGTLALNLSIRHGEKVRAVATINGSTGLYTPEQARILFDSAGQGFYPGIGSDICHPERREICYSQIPNASMQERLVLTTATGQMLPLLKQPLLVLQSRTDHVVDPQNALRIVQQSGSSSVKLRWLENSFHVATLDYDRDIIIQELSDFVTGTGLSARS